MIWFTSDLHFGHGAVLEYCKRPFESVAQMNAALVRNWNECVQMSDTVFVLGDLALCKYAAFETFGCALQGKKVLIKGNHDAFSRAQYERVGFTVYDEVKMKIAGRRVRLSHFPYAPPWWRRLTMRKRDLRYLDRRPPHIKEEWLLHGHTHSGLRSQHPRTIHVGVEAWGYRPVSTAEIEALMTKLDNRK